MKKTLKFLSWMFVALLAVTFTTSCSDDDEDDKGGIVGTWKCEPDEDGEYDYYTFNSDGTGSWTQVLSSGASVNLSIVNYVYDPANGLLTIRYSSGVESWKVSLSGKSMVFYDYNISTGAAGYYYDTYTRQ